MSIAVQRRRGASADHATFTGFDGEITVDTDKKTLVVHDGETAGGYPVAREDLSNVPTSELENLGFAKDDLSNVSSDNTLTSDLAKTDLSNVSVDTISDKGIAKDDLSNVDQSDLEEAFSFTAQGFINGLTIKRSILDTSCYIEIASGVCRDAEDTCFINLSSAFTKQIDANWVEGNGLGGFPQAISLSASTWYHVFVIFNPETGDIDAGFDTSTDASNLLSAASVAGFTKYRRVGSIQTDESFDITPFLQIGDYFYRTRLIELNLLSGYPTTGTALIISNCPIGIRTRPLLVFRMRDINDTAIAYIETWMHDDSSGEFKSIASQTGLHGGDAYNSIDSLVTDLSARIKYSVIGVTTGLASITSNGYIDDRRV